MRIFDFAIQMEVDGEDYYRKLANISTHPGLVSIFTYLADSELKHIEAIKEMKKERYVMQEVPSLKKAESLFASMKKDPVPLEFPEDEVKIYEKALKMEEESRDFYNEKAKEMLTPESEKAFRMLAQEEQRHVLIIQNVINFVYKPQWWVENAEFNPTEEDYE